MDFNLSEEQQLLKDSVERFVQDQYAFETRRALAAGDDGFGRDNWRLFAELGWLALPFGEAYGGFDGGPVETMVLMEAFGRGLVVEPYMATVILGGGLIGAIGSEAQKQELLPSVGAGETLLAFAFAEPASRFDLASVETVARRDGDSFLLSGKKSVVFNGDTADRIIVSARTGGEPRDRDGITLFLVSGDAAGLVRRGYPCIDGMRAAEIELNDLRVGVEAIVGGEGRALAAIETVIDSATAAVCAEALGAMSVLYETTLEYLKTRQQFGQPIGNFQVLQHRMVDMFTALELARSMTYYATAKLADPDPVERAKAVSAAKAQIGESGLYVGRQSVQLHGGIGMTDELFVSHYFKRLTMIDTLFGNADHHLDRHGAI